MQGSESAARRSGRIMAARKDQGRGLGINSAVIFFAVRFRSSLVLTKALEYQ